MIEQRAGIQPVSAASRWRVALVDGSTELRWWPPRRRVDGGRRGSRRDERTVAAVVQNAVAAAAVAASGRRRRVSSHRHPSGGRGQVAPAQDLVAVVQADEHVQRGRSTRPATHHRHAWLVQTPSDCPAILSRRTGTRSCGARS